MYNDNKEGVSVKLMHDARIKRQDDLYLVKVQIIYKRKINYFSTRQRLSIDQWKKLPVARSAEMVKLRNDLKKFYDNILAAVTDVVAMGAFSIEMLNIRLGRASAGSLNGAFQARIEELRQEARAGTMGYYKDVLRSIETYTDKEVAFEDVTIGWLKKFEAYMLKRGIRYSTIGMRMRGIRAILTTARREGLITEMQYPFGRGKYEIKSSEAHKRALTINQIAAIANYSDGNLETERYRDLWLFIYLCNGINGADLVLLKYRNIIDGEICFVREKTKRTSNLIKEIRATLTPEMSEIIRKWGNPPSPDNYIFPLIEYTDDPMLHAVRVKDFIKKTNKRTKKIGEALGFGSITTYTARHSFATVLKRSGANIAFISESLGHSDVKTTASYLSSFEASERAKNASFLTQYKKIE